MAGLGRTPTGFRQAHVCAKCDTFGPLWDLTYAKWCDDCVRSNGGLLAAGKEVQDAWRAAADLRSEQNGLKPINRGPIEVPRDPATLQRAETLHKAMKCTIEEAYDRLVVANNARAECTPTSA